MKLVCKFVLALVSLCGVAALASSFAIVPGGYLQMTDGTACQSTCVLLKYVNPYDPASHSSYIRVHGQENFPNCSPGNQVRAYLYDATQSASGPTVDLTAGANDVKDSYGFVPSQGDTIQVRILGSSGCPTGTALHLNATVEVD